MSIRTRLSRLKGRLNAWIPRRGESDCAVLMYHRVIDRINDPWGIAVSVPHFEGHLQAIRKAGFATLTVAELMRERAAGRSPRKALAISFDDGYADNFDTADDLLRGFGMPATVFVTSGYVGRNREFWWDALERIFLMPGRLPGHLSLELPTIRITRSLGDAEYYSEKDYRAHLGWRERRPPPTERHVLFLEVWRALKDIEEADREKALSQLFAWAGLSREPRETHRIMTEEELCRFAANERIEIGGHTVAHSALAALSTVEQREELAGCRQSLERITGKPVVGMSYPHGSYSDQTLSLATEAGYSYACTTSNRPLRARQEPLEVPRLLAPDVDRNQFRESVLRRISKLF